MLYWVLGIIISLLIIVLCIISSKKIKNYYQTKLELETLQYQKNDLENDIKIQQQIIEDYNEKILQIKDRYNKELNKKTDDLNEYFENQKKLRQNDLDLAFEQQEKIRQENLNLKIHELNKKTQIDLFQKQKEVANEIEFLEKAQRDIAAVTQMQEERFESLLEPLRKYEMDQQEKLFYTIQVPDEYKDDIDYLITTVSQKVSHPDIINKLVWTEYVRPYIEQTFKRVGIEDKPGIYKLTNIDTGKCYIGKSTNLKKRITDHFKSSIGIKTIADQAVHHEIWKTGFWNWLIEPIIYSDKNQLTEMEKYYINFFKSNIFGYNKTNGGEG